MERHKTHHVALLYTVRHNCYSSLLASLASSLPPPSPLPASSTASSPSLLPPPPSSLLSSSHAVPSDVNVSTAPSTCPYFMVPSPSSSSSSSYSSSSPCLVRCPSPWLLPEEWQQDLYVLRGEEKRMRKKRREEREERKEKRRKKKESTINIPSSSFCFFPLFFHTVSCHM